MRLAIISDIHEDIIYLQRALDKIQRLRCDEVICLGDISGFSVPHHDYFESRNASACLTLVRENCSIIIAGNHDLHAAKRTAQISGFEYPANWYELDFQQRFLRSMDEVWLYDHEELNALYSHEELKFVSKLPEYEIHAHGDSPFLFTHFIYPNLTGSEKKFYFDAEDYKEHKQFMVQKGVQCSFSGHRHYPGLMIVANSKIIVRNFGRKYKLKLHDSVLVPAITRTRGNSGFCVYDVDKGTVQAIRV